MSKRVAVRILLSASGVVLAFLVLVIAASLYLWVLSSRLPDLKADPDALKGAETSIVYAADGTVLAEWYDEQDRRVVSNDAIPSTLKDAAVAIEDKRFYEHSGVDPQSIMRALAVNTEAGAVRQGGSTITQQTVKLLFTDGRRSITRKMEEALLALQLESRADKQDVLGVYLNTVYFGRGAYGVESAAQRFFGISADRLTLAQSALLAGCIQSPSRYDPFANPADALERRNVVLREMRDQGRIVPAEYSKASAEPLGLKEIIPKETFAPYFVEYVRRDLIKRLGSERLYHGGLRIYTTLEPAAQVAAEAAAAAVLPSPDDPEVAVASLRWSDGSIVAIVGGRDFQKEKFDLATQGKRQTGSAFKPFVLAAALEEGYTLDTKFEATPFSTPVRDGIWRVENYENKRAAPRVSLRTAMVYSVNTVFARLIMRVGPKKVVDVARRMGIKTPIAPEPAIALGGLDRGVSPLEMASAFGTIANGGRHIPPTAIDRVTDASGEIVYQPERVSTRAISEQHAKTLATVLNEVYAKGTGVGARFGKWGAVKTGTAQSWRDAWLVGYAGDLSTAVWIGYPEAQIEMTNVRGIAVTGGSYPAQVWKRFMVRATLPSPPPVMAAATTTGTLDPGEGYSVYRLCSDSIKLARSSCPEVMELVFKTGGGPQGTCALKH